ncbi:MAG: UDP-N-acetylmuramate dehydrogenase [Candidatus Magasanikbacteria bacterium]|nr:UDP-N-acetylmuramate dehydrogenase [Candidatus Magasanikbacteria bacterium]
MDLFYNELKNFGKVRANEPMSKHTTYKIGGSTKYFVEVGKMQNFVDLLKFLEGSGKDYFILGGGSNILVSDEGYDGVVVKVKVCEINVDGNLLTASAGCATVDVARKSMEVGLTGFEWGVGIPGTIGGAVRGNAGAMGGEVKDFVKEVEIYKDGEVIKITNKESGFGYRDSRFKTSNEVVLKVVLELEKGEAKEGMKQAIKNIQQRNLSQPQGFSSSGCIFKNYEIKNEEEKEELKKKGVLQEFLDKNLVPVGWLVESLGIKGLKSGNAQISEKHCNFILNLGGATASDILVLIEKIKAGVYDKYSINIEEEIRIL